jgi:hypothetical protein
MVGWMRQATTGFASSEREEIGIRNEDWKETDMLERMETKELGDNRLGANLLSIFYGK